MTLSDNMRLYDIATRQALYVEGVKVQQAQELEQNLFALSDEFKKIFSRVKYSNLDALTKAELNRLVAELRYSQLKVYTQYTNGLIQQLQDFMAVNLEVSRRIYASANFELDNEPTTVFTDDEAIAHIEEQEGRSGIVPLFGMGAVTGDGGRLWSAIVNTPLPANGVFLIAFIKAFQTSAIASVEQKIRMAWANKWSVDETIAAIVGTGGTGRPPVGQGTSSQLDRINVQGQAVIDTVIAHVQTSTAAAVQSALYEWYGWYSVMDNRTTPICISRNLKRYRYGYGPIPPAHIRCRSHIAPIVGTTDVPEEMLFHWLTRQPKQVQNDMLGKDVATKLRNGEISRKDLSSIYGVKPLTLDQYKDKIELILSRRSGAAP